MMKCPGIESLLWQAAKTLAIMAILLSSFQLANAQADRVGSDMCGVCHDDVHSSFGNTLHRDNDCEDCHGAGSQHVEAGGDLTLSFTEQPAGWATLQCLHCHQDNAEQSGFLNSAHGRNSVSCVACHQVHPTPSNFGLLKEEEKDLCTSCHPATRADFRKPYHHPVMEGAVLCSDCHSPHSEDNRPPSGLWQSARERAVFPAIPLRRALLFLSILQVW